jgi:hypothetical protein
MLVNEGRFTIILYYLHSQDSFFKVRFYNYQVSSKSKKVVGLKVHLKIFLSNDFKQIRPDATQVASQMVIKCDDENPYLNL